MEIADGMAHVKRKRIIRKIIDCRAGGRVERCHGLTHLKNYTVASHSWGAAMLLYYLWPNDFPRLAAHVLAHDVNEYLLGDIPAPVKKYCSEAMHNELGLIGDKINHELGLPCEMDMLNRDDTNKVRACDYLEFYLWCREEMALGNTLIEQGVHEIVEYLGEAPLPQPADEIFADLCAMDIQPRQAGRIKEILGRE